MNEMVDRVAKVLKEREDEWLLREGDALGALAAENIEPLYHAMARAALSVMREPTKDMTFVILREGYGGVDTHEHVAAIWHPMIDAALLENADAEV